MTSGSQGSRALRDGAVRGAADGRTLVEVFDESRENPIRWRTKYTNYRQAFLYTVKRGKSGIRKYYCGWDTVVQLAAGNIRLLMELVERCFVLAHEQERAYGARFDPDLQTRAFQSIGRQSVVELSSAVDGARANAPVARIGTSFRGFAAQPLDTPEVSQFKLPDVDEHPSLLNSQDECDRLLQAAVMELVLLRQYSTKLTSVTESRDFEYRLHPVFSPFFVIPAGKKRRMTITSYEIVELASDTRRGIRHILPARSRSRSRSPSTWSFTETSTVPTLEAPIPTEVFETRAALAVDGDAVYVYGQSAEERSHFSEDWRAAQTCDFLQLGEDVPALHVRVLP